MSRWKSESALLIRYASSGVFNTVCGFAVILGLMALGASPVVANVSGYFVGFVLGFLVSKKIVFRSNGHFVAESLRYLVAFVFCFALNLAALQVAIVATQWPALASQIVAAGVYTSSMYAMARYYVYRKST